MFLSWPPVSTSGLAQVSWWNPSWLHAPFGEVHRQNRHGGDNDRQALHVLEKGHPVQKISRGSEPQVGSARMGDVIPSKDHQWVHNVYTDAREALRTQRVGQPAFPWK